MARRIPKINSSVSTSYDLWINLGAKWAKLKTFKKAEISHSRSVTRDNVLDSENENGYREMVPQLETYKLSMSQTRLQKKNAIEGLGLQYPTDRLIRQDTPFEIERREYFSDGTVRVVRMIDAWISSWTEPLSIDQLMNAENLSLDFGRLESR